MQFHAYVLGHKAMLNSCNLNSLLWFNMKSHKSQRRLRNSKKIPLLSVNLQPQQQTVIPCFLVFKSGFCWVLGFVFNKKLVCVYVYINICICAHNPFICTHKYMCFCTYTWCENESTPLPWALLSNSAWPESHQQHELHYDKGFDCDNLPEP